MADFESSIVYDERIQGMEVIFTEIVDFEGNEIPEIVIGTNDEGTATECSVTIYKIENDEWKEDMTFTYNSNTATFLDSFGKLTYDDGSLKEALAFSRFEAGASAMSQSFSILNYNEKTNAIEELINMPLESTDSLTWDLNKNTFTVTSSHDGTIFDYIFKNGHIIDSNGEAIGVIIDENLAELVGTSINNYFISLDDSYYVAKSKITEPLLDESNYETFFICNYEGGMHAYHITPANKVTVDDLSTFFNKTLEISEWENLMDGGYSYTAEVITESGMYQLEFNSNTALSLLESLTYIPN